MSSQKEEFDLSEGIPTPMYLPKGQAPADPNLFTTRAIKERISERHIKFQAFQIYAQTVLSFITAPLVAIHVSLQLSVQPHKTLYGDTVKQDEKALTKISKELTVQDRRKFELLVKSGATDQNRPFRAPVYGSYREVIRGLSSQGMLGFYKGNLIGLVYSICNSSLRFGSVDMLDYSNYEFYHRGSNFARGAAVFLTCSFVDMLCQPFQTIQSRFILQNRLPNFSLYKSTMDLLKRHRKQPFELYRGSMGHALKNAVVGLTWAVYDNKNARESYAVGSIAAHIVSYPIFTAIRRIECQSPLPGMIPKRYSGTVHALRLIAQEEGAKGLYKGFLAYGAQNMILGGFVMMSSQFLNTAIPE